MVMVQIRDHQRSVLGCSRDRRKVSREIGLIYSDGSSKPLRSPKDRPRDADLGFRGEARRIVRLTVIGEIDRRITDLVANGPNLFEGSCVDREYLGETAEHSDRMLAVITGKCDELVQNPLLVGPAARSISLDNRFDQFRPCRYANPILRTRMTTNGFIPSGRGPYREQST
ncbi:hypothetical protein VP03_26880 [Sinorhizobium meliloti]|nr:hypothetical protein VP03_26880 [Sinorhizobium meliloti]